VLVLSNLMGGRESVIEAALQTYCAWKLVYSINPAAAIVGKLLLSIEAIPSSGQLAQYGHLLT
jgi:hypothetical protein